MSVDVFSLLLAFPAELGSCCSGRTGSHLETCLLAVEEPAAADAESACTIKVRFFFSHTSRCNPGRSNDKCVDQTEAFCAIRVGC